MQCGKPFWRTSSAENVRRKQKYNFHIYIVRSIYKENGVTKENISLKTPVFFFVFGLY